MRSSKAHGFIIRRTNFGEADKILTLFSAEQGKIKVLAKGVRRIKSRRAPHLELFNHVELIVRDGRTFLTVTEAKVLDDFSALKSDLKLSGYLFYLSEVLDKILPEHQPHPEIFSDLISLLSSLREAQASKQSSIKKFVVQLLWNLGYLPKGEYPKLGVTTFVESIIEKRIKSKKFLEEL